MKKILIASIAVATTLVAQSQDSKQSLRLSLFGGSHQLSYKMLGSKSSGTGGVGAGASYAFFFSPSFGASAGIGLSTLGSTMTLDYKAAEPQTDSEGDSYELRTHYSSLKEEQRCVMLDIPLSAMYRHRIASRTTIEASLGAMLSVAMQQTYKVKGGQIATTGYYKQWNVELSDIPEEGLRTYSAKPSGDLDLRPALSLFSTLSLSYSLSDRISLSTGAYMSYGVNSIAPKDSKPLLDRTGTYSSMLSSNLADKVRPVRMGVLIGVHYSIGK